MINITIELWPHGDESRKKLLRTIQIANDGTGTFQRGDYKARLNPKKPWTEKVVTDYPRQSYGVEELLRRVLNSFREIKYE